jgi:hypothetical protein
MMNGPEMPYKEDTKAEASVDVASGGKNLRQMSLQSVNREDFLLFKPFKAVLSRGRGKGVATSPASPQH